MSTRALFLIGLASSSLALAQNSGLLPPPPLPNVDGPVINLPSTTTPDANRPIIESNNPTSATPTMAPMPSGPPLQVPQNAVFVPSGAPMQFGNSLPMMNQGLSVKKAAPRTATVVDEILLDYTKSITFADFMRKMGPKVLPGDDIFLAKKIYMAPELLKVKRMPSLTLENGSFYIRTGKIETIVRAADVDTLDFDVNHQKINMPPFANATYRWNKIIDAMSPVQTSWISFLPVAYAAENSGTPTLSSLMAFSIISRITRANSRVETQVIVNKVAYAFDDIWKKAEEYKSSLCTDQLLLHLAQRMAEIQVSTLTCSKNNQAIFELPSLTAEEGKRSFTVDFKKMRISETAANLTTPIEFRKDFSQDVNLDYGGSRSRSEDKSSAEVRLMARRNLALRMKGTKWTPVKNKNLDAIETGEHIRELANAITSGDLCHRCGSFFEHSAKLIHLETDPELLQQQSLQSPAGGTNGVPAGTAAPNPTLGR
jgi:hypothetical protein